jgi:6-pyruvoyltetrahydropterin/6-carboxytetrahydropterin synthase
MMGAMPSYRLRVRARFEAAHHLTSYRGTVEAVHGHSWRVEAILETDRLDGDGMAWDFVEVKTALAALCAEVDHKDLNTVAPFDRLSPTTEHVAAWFFGRLVELLSGAPLVEVEVWEGPDCSATYRP